MRSIAGGVVVGDSGYLAENWMSAVENELSKDSDLWGEEQFGVAAAVVVFQCGHRDPLELLQKDLQSWHWMLVPPRVEHQGEGS